MKKWFKYRYGIDFDPESRYFYDQPEDQGMIDYVVSIVRNVLHGSNVLPLEHSNDFVSSNGPRLDIDPTPQFRIFRATPFVIYLAVDTSNPVGNNVRFQPCFVILDSIFYLIMLYEILQPLSTVKTALRALLNLFEPTDSIKMAVSSFEGSDSGPGTYLTEKLPPSAISDNAISTEISNLPTNENELNRNVGAAIRDAITKLEPYKDQGGSILYLVTASQSQSSELELDIVENLIKNNIQLVAVEAGGGTHNALQRFSLLSHGEYFPTESYGSSSFFLPANRLVASLASQDPLIIDRQIVTFDPKFVISQMVNEMFSSYFMKTTKLVLDRVGLDLFKWLPIWELTQWSHFILLSKDCSLFPSMDPMDHQTH